LIDRIFYRKRDSFFFIPNNPKHLQTLPFSIIQAVKKENKV